MNRFVVCLDGTWNNTAREIAREDGSRVYRPTNVLKLARATTLKDASNTTQITYYDAGVGAMNRAPDVGTRIVRWVDNSIGGGWGSGFEANIEEAYTFLANNYTQGDEIFIFGFSRGAAQARSLCQLIEWFGGFPTKNDVYYIPRIFDEYLNAQSVRESPGLWEVFQEARAREQRRPLDEVVPANIVFLGIWDTVLALGSRIFAGGGTTRKTKHFHTPAKPPNSVKHVRHAIAIDESRHDFQPEIFLENDGHPSLEQRWFAGVHSNVGGGLESDGLANCALHWIVKESIDAGLCVRDDFLRFYSDYSLDTASVKTLGFKLADATLRPVRGFNGIRDLDNPAGLTVDDSVFARLNASKDEFKNNPDQYPYLPDNLLQFLASHQEHDPKLGPTVLEKVKARRSS